MTKERFPSKWDASPKPTVLWMRQFDYFSRLFERIKALPGDVIECGVGHGTTFAMLAYFAGVQQRTLRGFDSFRGFPEPSAHDASWRNPQAGEWEVDETQVWCLLHNAGIPQAFPELRRIVGTCLVA